MLGATKYQSNPKERRDYTLKKENTCVYVKGERKNVKYHTDSAATMQHH